MRLFSFFVSLALLGSISAQSLINGRWSRPEVSQNVSIHCCIPILLDIVSSGSDEYFANYKYTSNLKTCSLTFMSPTQAALKLYKTGSTSDTESAYSEETTIGSVVYNFEASNETGTPMLNIFIDTEDPDNACDFTMTAKVTPAPISSFLNVVVTIIIAVVIVIIFGYKTCKKKSPGQNLLQQQPAIVTTTFTHKFSATVFVPVKVNHESAQKNYIAPNQFPNAQVNNINASGGEL